MENSGQGLNGSLKGSRKQTPLTRRKRRTPWGNKYNPQVWPNPSWESNELPDVNHLEGLPMSHPEFEKLREWWREKFENVMAPAPLEMPPLREVNH